MKQEDFWRALDKWVDRFTVRTIKELTFEVQNVECHVLIDERVDRGLGIIRGRGREFVVRDGRRFYKPEEIRAGVRTTHLDSNSHLALAWDKYGLSDRFHAFIGNGNLLSNPHFVCYRNDRDDGQRLFALLTEPYTERNYSCLVVWKDFNITIEDLTFTAHENKGKIEVDSVFIKDKPDKGNIKDDILYATYGQRLVRKGMPIFQKGLNLVEEFYDSRHVLLNPYYQESYDFGMDQIMANPELFQRAVDCYVVEMDTRIMGERVNLQELTKALAAKDYEKGNPTPGVRGIFQISEDGLTIRMTMHLALYPHNTIGIREIEGRRFVNVVQFPGLSNRAGVGISDMSQYLSGKKKFADAIMLDNGGDVIMYRSKLKTSQFVPGINGYEMLREPSEKDRLENPRMNSILLFVEKETGAIQCSVGT